MRTRIRSNGDKICTGAVRYVCVRLFAFLAIAGFGTGLMYRADNCCLVVAVGVFYLIVMTAMIIVILADQFDHEVLMRLREKA